jgi:hypothetical protein
MHLSNRHMELGQVIAAVAGADGLVAYLKQDDRPEATPPDFKLNALVAAVAREPADLGDLPRRMGWHRLKATPDMRVWTDDYSDVLGAILRKKLGR